MNNIVTRKIQSFTLVEISITILLSLIIVAMLYMALNIVVRQVNQPDTTVSEDISLVKTAIFNAFYESTDISYTEGNQILSCVDSIQTRQFYLESENIILGLEHSEILDTLWSGVYTFQLKQNEYNLVNDLYLNFPYQGDTVHVYITKEYSQSTLLNHKKISFEY